MVFDNKFVFFDNKNSLEFYYYLLDVGFNTEQVKLTNCTKFSNRINIKVTLNDYETIICPNLTMWSWFSVSKTNLNSNQQLNNIDVHEFSTDKQDFHKLLNFIYEDIDISKIINKIKNNINNISIKIENLKSPE